MSRSKRARVAATAKSGMVIGDNKVHHHIRIQWKLLAITAMSVVVLAAGGYGVFRLIDAKKNTSSNSPTGNNSTPPEHVSDYERAYSESLDGKPDALQALLEKKLQAATSASAKVRIYNQMMGSALNANQYDQAITWGMQAEALQPTSQTASLIASAYQYKGDIPNAKLWVQKAINELDKSGALYSQELSSLQDQLAGLGS